MTDSLVDSAAGLFVAVRLGGVALIAARVMPSVVMLPAFGAPALPLALRIAMGVSASVWLSFAFPFLQAPSVSWLLFLTAARELAVGLSLAWLGFLVFRAVGMAGEITDVFRRTQGELHLETEVAAGSSSSSMSVLWGLLAVLLFAELGGPAHIIAALARSYEVLPLFSDRPMSLSPSFVGFAATTIGGICEVAVGLAAPVMVAIWLSELLVAVAGRLVVGNGMGGEAFVRLSSPLVGLAMLLMSLGFVRAGIEGWIVQVPSLFIQVVTLWGR